MHFCHMTIGNSTKGNIIQFHREVRTICRIRGRRQSFYMCLMSRSSCRCWVCLALETSNSVLLFSVQGFFLCGRLSNYLSFHRVSNCSTAELVFCKLFTVLINEAYDNLGTMSLCKEKPCRRNLFFLLQSFSRRRNQRRTETGSIILELLPQNTRPSITATPALS